jgi:transposase
MTMVEIFSKRVQVFPEYRGVFGSLYSKVSLLTLLAFPTSETVLSVSEREL